MKAEFEIVHQEQKPHHASQVVISYRDRTTRVFHFFKPGPASTVLPSSRPPPRTLPSLQGPRCERDSVRSGPSGGATLPRHHLRLGGSRWLKVKAKDCRVRGSLQGTRDQRGGTPQSHSQGQKVHESSQSSHKTHRQWTVSISACKGVHLLLAYCPVNLRGGRHER